MKIIALSTVGKFATLAACALFSFSVALAEDSTDVLERIAPIGQVKVEEQAEQKPAESPATTPASVATSKKVPVEEPEVSAEEPEAPAEAPDSAEQTVSTEEVPAGAEEPASAEGAEATESAAPAAQGGEDARALAQLNGCMACHQVDSKVVGPAYKAVAKKYAGEDGALEMLVKKVKKGGSGTWGQVPMPPNAHVGEEKIRTIVSWILSL